MEKNNINGGGGLEDQNSQIYPCMYVKYITDHQSLNLWAITYNEKIFCCFRFSFLRHTQKTRRKIMKSIRETVQINKRIFSFK